MTAGAPPNRSLPLAGTRILAFTQLGAGPYAMTLLGDLGAEIIKVEDPVTGGDEARNVPPFAEDGDSLYFQALNRNARSMTLNLRVESGRDLLRRLAAHCDAIYCNTRGDLPAKLGLDYASLQDANPRIVCCSLTGYGRSGPRHAEPAYDYLLQSAAGFMGLTGDPGGPPTKAGVSVVDFSGGMMSALGLVIGLLRVRDTGIGGDVDVSLLDTALSMLNYLAAWNLSRGIEPTRLPDSAHPSLVPSQTFATADGYIVVMCMKQKFWQRLAACLDLDELAADPRFATIADRFDNRDELIPLLKERFQTHTTAEWLNRLRGQVPSAPVNSVAEALRDEQVLHRQMIVEYEHEMFGRVRQVGSPLKLDGVEPVYGPASRCGADTDEILRDLLDLKDEEIAELRRHRAI